MEQWRAVVHIYKDWEIAYNPKPISDRRHDWDATHKDYDGPEDGRYITGRSVEDLIEQIDEFEGG